MEIDEALDFILDANLVVEAKTQKTAEQLEAAKERRKARREAKKGLMKIQPLKLTYKLRGVLGSFEDTFEARSFKDIIKHAKDIAKMLFSTGKHDSLLYLLFHPTVYIDGELFLELTFRGKYDKNSSVMPVKTKEDTDDTYREKCLDKAISMYSKARHWAISQSRFKDDRLTEALTEIKKKHGLSTNGFCYAQHLDDKDIEIFDKALSVEPEKSVDKSGKKILPFLESFVAVHVQDAEDYDGVAEFSWIHPIEVAKVLRYYEDEDSERSRTFEECKKRWEIGVEKYLADGKPKKILIGYDYDTVPKELVPGLKTLYTTWPSEGTRGARYQRESSLYMVVGANKSDFKFGY